MQHDNFEINEDAVKDKIELSPIEKYIRFNKFPWKLVLHIALLVFTTVQAVNMVEIAATYQKPMLQVFKYVFLDSTDEDFSQTFYTLSDYQYHLGNLSETLSDLGSFMLNRVDSADATYNLEVYYTIPNASNPTLGQPNPNAISYTYAIPNISEGIQQPFNQSDVNSLKSFIQTIESMNFNINNLYTSSQLVEGQILCYNWSISIQYQFIAMSHIEAVLDAQPSYCQFQNNSRAEDLMMKSSRPKTGFAHSRSRSLSSTTTYTPFGNTFNVIHVVVFCLALASLGFGWYYIYEMGLLYMSTRHAKQLHQVNYYNEMQEDNKEQPYASTWDDLSFMEKVKFFDVFLVLMMIGNVFQILGSIISLYQNFTPEDSSTIVNIKEACVGLGCMCCWFNLIKYLSYNKQFKSTTNILSNSTMDFMKFLIGVIPLYMAFVFLGRCLFWKYEKFESTNHAIVALFAILAGDIIDETYTDTNAEGILATIYMTVWLILFMSAVHNVFISIISEGFRNKFLEDRYQELFNLYALGDKDEVSKWDARGDANMMLASSQAKKKKEDVLSLMPYIRRDSEIDFDPQNRERIRKTEMERQKLKETILEKTDEVEKILSNMKDIVNEFVSVSKDKEEKKVVKTSFLKCLKDLHLFIKTELSKDQTPGQTPIQSSFEDSGVIKEESEQGDEPNPPPPPRKLKKGVSFAFGERNEPPL